MRRKNSEAGRKWLRLIVLAPAIWFVLANQVRAESYDLECREVETSFGSAWLCQKDWLPPGSRISEEQRKTLNAVIVTTVVIPLSSRRR